MKVSSIQFAIKDAEIKGQRLARMAAMVESCQGSQLLVLPEIWSTGYFAFDRYAAEAESLDGETVQLMASKARKLQTYIMLGSIIEKSPEGLFNTSVLLNPEGQVAAVYRKIHLFGYGSEEGRLLRPGSQVTSVETALGTFGLATCYDLRFPELFRKLLDQNVDCFLVCAAWPFPRLDHWRQLNQVRAFENQCFLISANCAGSNRGTKFLGHSAVVDPWGIVLAGAGDEERIITTEIDLTEAKRAREIFPPVKDRVIFD